jgi:hypothetical protein
MLNKLGEAYLWVLMAFDLRPDWKFEIQINPFHESRMIIPLIYPNIVRFIVFSFGKKPLVLVCYDGNLAPRVDFPCHAQGI